MVWSRALCFKGSTKWSTVRNRYENLKFWDEFKQ